MAPLICTETLTHHSLPILMPNLCLPVFCYKNSRDGSASTDRSAVCLKKRRLDGKTHNHVIQRTCSSYQIDCCQNDSYTEHTTTYHVSTTVMYIYHTEILPYFKMMQYTCTHAYTYLNRSPHTQLHICMHTFFSSRLSFFLAVCCNVSADQH